MEQAVVSWFNLLKASNYSGLSVKSLRRAIDDPMNPLPARLVKRRWLIRQADLDAWIDGHPDRSGDLVDLGKIVDDVVGVHLNKSRQRAPAKASRCPKATTRYL